MKKIALVLVVGAALLAGMGPAEAKDFPKEFCRFTARMKRAAVDKKVPPLKRLAIVPFQGAFGLAASHQLMDTLNAQNNDYEILDRDHMDLTEAEKALVDKGIVDPAKAAALAKAHGCQAIIVGSLDDWGSTPEVIQKTKKVPKASPKIGKSLVGSLKGILEFETIQYTVYKRHVNVKISVQMINVETGAVISPISRPVNWCSDEFETDPGDDYASQVIDKVLGDTIWDFVRHISPYMVYVECGLHKEASEDSAKVLIKYLNADRTERAIEKALSHAQFFAKKGDLKDKAACAYNLAIVYEIADSLELALKYANSAQDMLIDGNETPPNPYGDACKRIKGEIEEEKLLQVAGKD